MGIRYFAVAVPPELVDQAASTPVREFLSSEPWGHRCDPDYLEPATLDLDKSWGYLQAVFGPEESPRPGYELVRGDVTHTCCGWKPFERFVPPHTVLEIARDLADVDEHVVREALSARRFSDDRFEEHVSYTIGHLTAAAAFTRELATSGSGVVYWIG